jgi:hypothetical protein
MNFRGEGALMEKERPSPEVPVKTQTPEQEAQDGPFSPFFKNTFNPPSIVPSKPPERDVRKMLHTARYKVSESCADVPFHGVYGGLNPTNGRAFMALFTERPALPGELNEKNINVESEQEQSLRTVDVESEQEQSLRTVGTILHCDIGVLVSIRKWIDKQLEEAKRANPKLSSFIEEIEDASREE